MHQKGVSYMDATPMSPADYAAMAGNDGFGGNFLAMIFLFALIFGFNGNGWHRQQLLDRHQEGLACQSPTCSARFPTGSCKV